MKLQLTHAVNGRQCPQCRETFSPQDKGKYVQRYCSLDCQWEAKRRPQPCAVCLYQIGYGIKRIAKIIGTTRGVHSEIVRAGLNTPEESLRRKQRGITLFRKATVNVIPEWANDLIFAGYNSEVIKLRQFENIWASQKNPAICRWLFLKQYHTRIKHTPALIEKRKRASHAWHKNNAGRKLEYDKQWRKNNPEKWRACVIRSRRKQDKKPKIRLLKAVRTRVRKFLIKGERQHSTSQLVGCSRKEFARWIERQFVSGMTWDNYGDWELDHKMPCAAFDLTDTDQLKRCCHYTNLQPLWKEDNHAKSNKILHPQFQLAV